ncbi:MAG TPA: peptidylprolyl isomerase [Opitutaceae bacterium]|nr:peptidylprolyl isomerase [Opitutaceae bacterium]
MTLRRSILPLGLACFSTLLALPAARAQPMKAPTAPAAPAAEATRQQAPDDNLDLRFANGIAAQVEDRIITVDDVRHEISPLIPQLQRQAHNEKEFNDMLESLQDDTIQGLIDRVLIVKEFRKPKGEEEEPRSIPATYIDSEIARQQAENFDNDRSKFLAYLRSQGKTIREFRRDTEEDIIVNYMKQQQRKSQSMVSPVKIEQYYNENKERFYQEDQVHLRMIQFSRGEGETDAQLQAKADEVMRRLKGGEKFEDLAKIYSQDPKRSKGGDWGWQNLSESEMRKEFRTALLNAKKGDVPDPVFMPEGCFLLYVEDRKYAGIEPLDAVRPQIEAILTQQMAAISQQRWLERLRRDAYIKHY